MLAGGFIEEEDVGELPEDETKSSKTETIDGKILEIRSAEISGNTVFYFKLDTDEEHYYMVSVKDNPLAPIINTGDEVSLLYMPEEGLLLEADLMKYNE